MFITKKNKNCFRKFPKIQKIEASPVKEEAKTVIVKEVEEYKEAKKKRARAKKEVFEEAVVEDKEVKDIK